MLYKNKYVLKVSSGNLVFITGNIVFTSHFLILHLRTVMLGNPKVNEGIPHIKKLYKHSHFI